MRRMPWISAAILAMAAAASLNADPSWAGDWNETGTVLGSSGMVAATLAGLPLALYARRNIEPLRSLELGCGGTRMAGFLLRRCLAPSLLAWLLVVATAYAITAGLNPTPTSPSAWPPVAATAAVLAVLALSLALGLFLHPAFSLPLVILVTYIVPVTLDWVDADGTVPGFTPLTSLHLFLPLTPVPTHFVFQTLFLMAIAAGALLLSQAQLRRRSLRLPAAAAALLVGAGGALVTIAPPAIGESLLTDRYVCSEADGARVCLLPDHERFLPRALGTAEQIAQVLPPGSRPSTYIEDGIDYPSAGDSMAFLSASGVRTDPSSAVAAAAADWNVCFDEEHPFSRESWLHYKLGMWPLEDLVEMDGMEFMSDASEDVQLTWWNEPLGSTC
ncbi:hypothetical protein SAMN05216355_11064 [Actinomyces ruminicola]|uniref:ABC-type transport system involved in multi-copper enzyme maturation, permease component n=2 Tax=Actinomyces ruminicola TaxID=332524 RepID=A0A1H0DFW8_9ACTO|nr:hypothetical protein SAMN05216355_11064 [Actinomyces ruminicola]